MFQTDALGLRPEENHHRTTKCIDTDQDPIRVMPNVVEHDWPRLVHPEGRRLLSGLGHVDPLVSKMSWEDLRSILGHSS